MGGADKPLVLHNNKPMIQQVLARLGAQVGRCVVSANRNLEQYQHLADAVLPQHAPISIITDQLADYQGPLAGIHSALHQCKTPWFVVCPGDAPTLPHNLLDSLSKHRNPAYATVAHDGERQQQLHFLGHCSLLKPLEQYLQSGRRSVAGFHEANAAVSVHFGAPQDFASINRVA
jgi:molybdopterin-guanine dinucleotide biosynthesis protein A